MQKNDIIKICITINYLKFKIMTAEKENRFIINRNETGIQSIKKEKIIMVAWSFVKKTVFGFDLA